jgi:hypothetical protein
MSWYERDSPGEEELLSFKLRTAEVLYGGFITQHNACLRWKAGNNLLRIRLLNQQQHRHVFPFGASQTAHLDVIA